jgi:hypothetical protein
VVFGRGPQRISKTKMFDDFDDFRFIALPADDTISHDYFEIHRSRAETPEIQLLRAVLETGIREALGEVSSVHPRYRQAEIQSAKEWILSDEGNYVFSFVEVCAALGIEPGAIRRLVKGRIK